MLRTWKKVHFYALLAATLAAAPALGEQKDADDSAKTQLDRMERSLKKANESLEALKKQVEDLKVESKASLAVAQTDILSLKQEISRLRDEMQTLRNGISGSTRVAASPPSDPRPAPAGVVELVNTYVRDVSIVVNNRTYRLHPNESRVTDPIPAGTFTYEVLGVTPSNTRRLNPNETYRITVHPQL